MHFREITKSDDAVLAEIIRRNLKQYGLAVPGTVYFDEGLDCLSSYYLNYPTRKYWIAEDEDGTVLGGIGLAEFEKINNCAELQKLYLSDAAKGHGYGRKLIAQIEQTAREMGFTKMYLETHTNLAVAVLLYEKCGYQSIERPAFVQHGAMNRFYLKTL